MKTISHKLFDSSFTRHLLDSLSGLGIRDAAQAANDGRNEGNSRRDLKKAISALRKLSDTELHDLGISRGEIAYVVQHGRPGVDPDPDPASLQAA